MQRINESDIDGFSNPLSLGGARTAAQGGAFAERAAAMTGFDDLIDTSRGFGGTPIANGDFGTWTDWNVLNYCR